MALIKSIIQAIKKIWVVLREFVEKNYTICSSRTKDDTLLSVVLQAADKVAEE